MMGIRILLDTFYADPDTTVYFDADPAPRQSNANLRPLVYRPSMAPFEPLCLHCERLRPSKARFWSYTAPEFWVWCRSRSGFWLWFNTDPSGSRSKNNLESVDLVEFTESVDCTVLISSSVVDPDPVRPGTFCAGRIHVQNLGRDGSDLFCHENCPV